MAELSQKERLQPSLLDRLINDAPKDELNDLSDNQRQKELKQRILSLPEFRKAVLRDLEWLLNTNALDSAQNLENYPFVSHSVVNYGIHDLVGTSLSNADVPMIQRQIRQAIWDFEPRILKESVTVKVSVADEQMNKNAMTFVIEGDLWAQPLPLHLYLKTKLDLETGNVEVIEGAA